MKNLKKLPNRLLIVLMVISVIILERLNSNVGVISVSIALGYFMAMNAADEWLEDDNDGKEDNNG